PVNIVKWDGAGMVKELSVSVGPEFAKQVLEGWVVQGDQVYRMGRGNAQLEFRDSDRETYEAFLEQSGNQQLGYLPPEEYQNGTSDDEAEFRKLARPLVVWVLGTKDLDSRQWPSSERNDHVQLFLFARSPASFGVSNSQFGHEIGYVL